MDNTAEEAELHLLMTLWSSNLACDLCHSPPPLPIVLSIFYCVASQAETTYNNLAKNGRAMVLAFFVLKVENFNGRQSDLSHQIHVLSGFKRFALACHKRPQTDRQNIRCKSSSCLSYTLYCCQFHSLLPHPLLLSSNWLYSLILCHTLSVSLTIALFGLIEEYEMLWRDISAASPTDMPIHFAAGDLTS